MDNTKDWKFYYDELMSDECACGKSKQPSRSFCYGCYMALPGDMRRDLWKRIREGYEEAYEAAVKQLEL